MAGLAGEPGASAFREPEIVDYTLLSPHRSGLLMSFPTLVPPGFSSQADLPWPPPSGTLIGGMWSLAAHVARALSRHQGSRFPTAREFAEELLPFTEEAGWRVPAPTSFPISTPASPSVVGPPPPPRSQEDRPCPISGPLGIPLMWVPGGRFRLGQSDGGGFEEAGAGVERVIGQSFELGVTPVTQGQWEAVMGHNPSYCNHLGPEHPVERMTRLEAVDFCNAMTGRANREGWRGAF